MRGYIHSFGKVDKNCSYLLTIVRGCNKALYGEAASLSIAVLLIDQDVVFV
ncbi:hypothetical protein DPMN_016114 [Dreissena polymorpha]|uniref:Uncharacterized protein n=1 Tax=Dreissena polymorpha TaxID=45954 RepID=A0A9D4S681_DREPO|nr:hypothetical protein DPMN_016114 [Dreissena polymorpha]